MHDVVVVPTIPNRTRIPVEAIRDVVSQIADRFHPQRVILFGSYAYGNPRPESDVDLLVIMPTEKTELAQAAAVCQQLNYHFGLDLIVITPQNLKKRIELGDSFLKEILRQGITIYESIDG